MGTDRPATNHPADQSALDLKNAIAHVQAEDVMIVKTFQRDLHQPLNRGPVGYCDFKNSSKSLRSSSEMCVPYSLPSCPALELPGLLVSKSVILSSLT